MTMNGRPEVSPISWMVTMFGMVERGGGPRLLGEAAHAAGVGGEPLGQELHRDVAVKVEVARAPDLAHAPCAQAGEKLVATETHPC